MKIYFLRHTTLDIEDNIFYGQTDVDVSSNFVNEVSLIKKKFDEKRYKSKKILVISSPLKRCENLLPHYRYHLQLIQESKNSILVNGR